MNEEPQSVLWRTDEGCITALLVARGHKLLHLVTMPTDGLGVRLRKVPAEYIHPLTGDTIAEERFMTPLEHKGKPYPVERHVEHLLHAGERFGIVKGTEKLLRGLL